MPPSDRGLPVGVGASDPLDRVLDADAPQKFRRLLATVMIGGAVVGGGSIAFVLAWLAVYPGGATTLFMVASASAVVGFSVFKAVRFAWRFGFVDAPVVDEEAVRLLRAVGPVAAALPAPTAPSATTPGSPTLPSDARIAALLRQDR